jgi:hypothetical protein
VFLTCFKSFTLFQHRKAVHIKVREIYIGYACVSNHWSKAHALERTGVLITAVS